VGTQVKPLTWHFAMPRWCGTESSWLFLAGDTPRRSLLRETKGENQLLTNGAAGPISGGGDYKTAHLSKCRCRLGRELVFNALITGISPNESDHPGKRRNKGTHLWLG